MKIIIISDSHGNKQGIDKIFKDYKFDYLVFCGDGLDDLGDYIYLDNVFAVSGNCDFFSREPNELVFELEGSKFLITHGHKYKVKLFLDELYSRAKELNANYVLYGHTHIQRIDNIDNICFFNPGSFKYDKYNGSKAIILNIDNKTPNIEYINI